MGIVVYVAVVETIERVVTAVVGEVPLITETQVPPDEKKSVLLTHWPMEDTAVTLILWTFSKPRVIRVGMSSISCEIALGWMPHYLTGDWPTLVPVVKQQAITWTSVDWDVSRPRAWLGHNELTYSGLVT